MQRKLCADAIRMCLDKIAPAGYNESGKKFPNNFSGGVYDR